MRIATLERQLAEGPPAAICSTGWRDAQPDVACLQETKTEDANFPSPSCARRATTRSIAGRRPITASRSSRASRNHATVAHGIPDFADDPKRVHRRHRAMACASSASTRPTAQAPGTDKYAYKMRWYEALARWLREELARTPSLAVLGDMNVAPRRPRRARPEALGRARSTSREPEREALRKWSSVGLRGRLPPVRAAGEASIPGGTTG